MIEAAAAGARRRDHQAIECRTAALVLIEAVAHELAEEASALRVAEADDATHQRRVLAQRRRAASELEIGREIAHGRETESGNG